LFLAIYYSYQGCGYGSGLDPHSITLWILFRIRDPDPVARKWS
jgi:hypothetical protein